MICRKCGAELSDNAVRCSNCGIRVSMTCPECKTLNSFGNKNCVNCGAELLVSCNSCGSINLYSSSYCRKCNAPLKLNEQDLTSELPIENTEQENEEVENSSFPIDDDNTEVNTAIGSAADNEILAAKETEIIDEETENTPIEAEIPVVEENIQEETKQNNIETTDEYDLYCDIRPETVKNIINLIKTSLDKHIIAVNGDEGSGKTAVINQVNNYLSENGFLILYGSCTPLVQITSFGFFQDAFLRMMGFPPYINNNKSFTDDFKKSNFSEMFSSLDDNELSLFLNIFYPSMQDNFENILKNKKKMFSILEKVLRSFLENNNVIISIDNFELLDGASYDFIINLLNKGFFNSRLKLLAAYQGKKLIQSYFDLTGQEEDIFETVMIEKFNNNDLINTVNKSMLLDLNKIENKPYIQELTEKSGGNAVKMEQEIALLIDLGYISSVNDDTFINESKKPQKFPESFEELIKIRINTLTPNVKNVLFTAAAMGYRFASGILCFSSAMSVSEAKDVLNYLIEKCFIQQVDNYTCEFKSLTLWKLIYQEAKSDLLYKENSERLYKSLKPLILSSNLQKLISCTEALSKNEEFLIWKNTASITAKLGDTNLYIIASKQCLKVLNELEIENSEEIKNKIYEEIGKLLCEKSPNEAVTYLANVLDSEIKKSNTRKIIDISGYFIKSCCLSGKYYGAAEAVDAVIKALSKNKDNISELDIALIKTRKLKSLLNIGNSAQIINLVNEEIIPVLEKNLNSGQIEDFYKDITVRAWLTSKTVLAKAYAQQGNNYALNVTSEVRKFMENNNLSADRIYYLTQLDIIDAFARTAAGEIKTSNEILNSITGSYKNKAMKTDLLAQWNLINIVNRVLLEQNGNLKTDLFELAAFANNINEHFIKNIIKLMLGYLLKEEGNTVKALEIFNEEITYFAKEKAAFGALLSWALIVQISLLLGDNDKALNTAVKSLEIAQSPKINNYLFIIYFQKFIAEIYLKKNDLASVKMYLEKSIVIAKQFDLKYQLIELYIDYAKYMEALMAAEHNYSVENVKTSLDLYNSALNIAKELELDNMSEKAARACSEFKTFCRLNSISF